MAPELRKRKEKQAVEAPPAKKPAKSEATKRKAVDDASPVTKKKQKPVETAGKASKSTSKKSTTANGATEVGIAKDQKKKVTKKPAAEAEPAEDEETPASDDGNVVDAQTQALVSAIDDKSDDELDGEETFSEGQEVGTIPAKAHKALAAAKSGKGDASSKDKRGVIYVGRLPHGFFEHEMRGYFSQFGDITRLRLSRNKKTGASKHYAFIEFEDREVAEIVAKTMDAYLLFGHILRVKVVPASQVPKDLWKGANRRFKKVPRNAMAGRELEQPRSETQWNKKIVQANKKREARAEKLKALGYDYEAPELAPAAALEAAEKPKAIEAPPAEAEVKGDDEVPVKSSTAKKAKGKKKKMTT